jgi:hypothetical protein
LLPKLGPLLDISPLFIDGCTEELRILDFAVSIR